MTEQNPTYIISDLPEDKVVDFNFDTYAKTIADLIAYKKNRTPLVIGVYGPWGSGKTTLMKTVQERLVGDAYDDTNLFRHCKTVWFQVWKYAEEEQILAALIEEIFRTMKRNGFFEARKADLEGLVKRLRPFKMLGKAVETLTGIDPAEFIDELEYKQKLGFYDTFQEFFDRLIWTYTRMRPRLNADEAPDDTKGALVVFIDDLDRCPQERIVRVLETIKLFMDKIGCVFVLGADNEIIEAALSKNFGSDNALRFMDKIVQVTFRLPRIPAADFENFIKTVASQSQQSIEPHLPVIMPVIRYNPRQLKRFINNVNLLEGLLRNSNMDVPFSHLLFWNVLDLACPYLAKDLIENPATLNVLREHIGMLSKQQSKSQRWDPSPEMLKAVPKSLQGYLRDKCVVDLLSQFDITREQLICLCTLSSVVMAEEEKIIKEQAHHAPMGDEDMVLIPAGTFLYSKEKKPIIIEADFHIDIYPVTNGQFNTFIEDKGYATEAHWSVQGLKWRKKAMVSSPKYWADKNWNHPEQPVVGVSWYEADAYARWAGKALPTEIQWERAARGTDARQYPWGEAFDEEKCNTSESGIGKTTRVTRYPNGISPEGCYDMAGNVWEWTRQSDQGGYVLRGGCWHIDHASARCANRGRYNPDVRDSLVGFRCIRTSDD